MKLQLENITFEKNQLFSEKIHLEGQVSTLNTKVDTLEAALNRYKLKGDTEASVKISALQQQLVDKEDLITQMSALLEETKKQKVVVVQDPLSNSIGGSRGSCSRDKEYYCPIPREK
jgi:hypothetical protein